MSSLRLALKQSLEESGQAAAQKREKERRRRDDESRRRKKREQGPKKRGPGRPRKDGSSSYQSPHGTHQDTERRRMNGGSTTGSSDDDDHYSEGGGGSSSSENEFSGSSDNDTHEASVDAGEAANALFNDSDDSDSEEDDYSAKKRKKMQKKQQRAMKRHRNSAANRIQNQWKKKQGKDTGSTTEPTPSKRRKKKSRDRNGSAQKAENASIGSKPPSSSGKAQTVSPPASDIVHWIRQMSVEAQRDHITAGHRVKVRFETKKRRDGKFIRRRKWYGGLVTGVSTGGSKIRIKYDDGTSEVSKYPDEDIVVDEEGNGRHRVSAEMFLPPETLEREEMNSPQYQSPSTIDDNSEHRERVRVKKSRKMALSPKNARPKLSFSKGRPKSHDRERKTSAPVSSVEIPSKRTPSPEIGEVQLSHSHDSTESSGSSTFRSADSSPTKGMERMEIVAKSSDDIVAKSGGSTEKDDHHKDKEAEKDALSRIPSTDSTRSKSMPDQNEPHDDDDVVEEKPPAPSKPTLTIRLIPPKAKKDGRGESDIRKQSRAEDSPSDDGDQSSDEEMSIESVGHAGDSATKKDESSAADDTPKPGVAEEAIAQPIDQYAKSKAVVSGQKRDSDSLIAGKKRQFVDDVDSSVEPPAKRHNASHGEKDDERRDASLPSLEALRSSQTKNFSNDGRKPVDAPPVEKETADAQNEEAVTSKVLEEPVPRVKQVNRSKRTSPSDSKPRTLSSSSRESPDSIPSQKSAKRKKKRNREMRKDSSSPHSAQINGDSGSTSSKDSGSPTPLSADPKKSTDEAELSKPVSTIATAVKLDAGDRSENAKGHPVLTGSKYSAFHRKGSTASSASGEKLQRSPDAASGSDDESMARSTTPVPKGTSIPVARSGRRAAQQANQRIAARQEIVIQDPFLKAKKKKEKAELRKFPDSAGKRKQRTDEVEEDDDDPHWVQCDNCLKWRVLPSSVDTDKLPRHWYCEMNVYDSTRNSCDAPEQTAEEIKKTKKRGKKARVARSETPTELQDKEEDKEEEMSFSEEPAVEEDVAPAKDRPYSRSPPVEKKEATGKKSKRSSGESTPKPKRSSPSSTISSVAPESPQSDEEHVFEPEESEKKKASAGASSAKKAKSSEADEGNTVVSVEENAAEISVPKKRGRKKKEKGGKKGGKEAENQEWVQCEKCEKWRRLPKDIAAEDLPEVWYCNMNTWDPITASCDAEEDKADPNTREYNIFGSGQSSYGTSGKLSYRNLIFGAAGRRQNRPISERTRAAESLFTSLTDDNSDGQGYPKVMYANSSAFVPRKSHHSIEEPSSMSFFDLMSHSNLWAELRAGTGRSTVSTASSGRLHNGRGKMSRSFDGLPKEAQSGLKEMVYHALGAGVLAGHEVLLEAQCRKWENMPQQWDGLRASCTLDLVTAVLSELVKSGLVEVAGESNTSGGLIENIPRYRRVGPSEIEPAAVPKPRRSRCMKISKPWKRASTDQWCM